MPRSIWREATLSLCAPSDDVSISLAGCPKRQSVRETGRARLKRPRAGWASSTGGPLERLLNACKDIRYRGRLVSWMQLDWWKRRA